MGDKKKGFFGRLVEGLTKTRDSIVSGIDSVFSGFSAIDDDFYEEIEMCIRDRYAAVAEDRFGMCIAINDRRRTRNG